MMIVSRTKGGYGCPYCSGRKVLPGFNDLATTHSLLASQALGWNPNEVSAGSGRKLDWKCGKGHTFTTSPLRRLRGDGCPICSGKRVLQNFNDLATTHPQLAKEAFEIDPRTITAGTQKSIKWRCSKLHIYTAPVSQRTRRGTGCPYCVGQKLLEGFNDLLTKSPQLAAEADGWDPRRTYFRSNKKLRWKCPSGHTYHAQASNRQFNNTGCPYCAGKKILTNFNDLQTLFPELAKEANGWDPKAVSPNSHKRVSWRCSCGYVWSASPNHRLQSTKKLAQKSKLAGCARCVSA